MPARAYANVFDVICLTILASYNILLLWDMTPNVMEPVLSRVSVMLSLR